LNGDDKSGHKCLSATEDGSIVYNCEQIDLHFLKFLVILFQLRTRTFLTEFALLLCRRFIPFCKLPWWWPCRSGNI